MSEMQKLFESEDIEEKYQDALDKIRQHQQTRIFRYDIILLVIIGGFCINLISSALYDIIVNKSLIPSFILCASAVLLVSTILLSFYSYNKYKPAYVVEMDIRYDMWEILSSDYDIDGVDKIKKAFEHRQFIYEDFCIWHDSFKEMIVNNDRSYFYILFDLKFIEETRERFTTKLIFNGVEKGVRFKLEIFAVTLGLNRSKPLPNTMSFGLNFQIYNPESPFSDEFLFDLKTSLLAELIREHHIDILNSLIYYIDMRQARR